MNVLIVDDQAHLRTILRIALETKGLTVCEAQDGVDALAVLEQEPVDAIISDVLMPRMDGYQLCQAIRANPRFFALPFICYSANYVSPADAAFSIEAGADKFLRKPTSIDAILQALEETKHAVHPRPQAATAPQPIDLTRQYSERLVAKLEEKNIELEHLNHELAESRARFESIIASAMDAIITIDHECRIVLFNAAAEKMFGASAAAMLGQPLENLLPGHFRAKPAEASLAADETGPACQQTSRLGAISGRRAGGEEFPIEASISKTEITGKEFFTVILRDISERKRAELQLRTANEQLHALAARSEAVREQERTAIAREIHDVLAQELTRLKIDLVWLAKRAAKPYDDDTRRSIEARITEAIAQTDTAISTVQRIATELRPVILDSLGLPAAAEWQVEDFARRTGLTSHTRAPQGESTLSRACATALFRILQESLTNIARHAQATHVDVQLREEDGTAILIIADDGCGITAEQLADPRSIGIVGMRERAQAFGGTVTFTGRPGAGTTIEVRIPIEVSS